MKCNQAGLDILKTFEGCRLTAYRCPAGVLTIGYGSTQNVCEGMTITMDEAIQRLQDHLSPLEVQIGHMVKVPLSENEFSALVCLAYNIGIGNLEKSTLLKLLNQGARDGAAQQFLVWTKAAGRELPGLTRRREAERELFLRA
jgi:lysozyme